MVLTPEGDGFNSSVSSHGSVGGGESVDSRPPQHHQKQQDYQHRQLLKLRQRKQQTTSPQQQQRAQQQHQRQRQQRQQPQQPQQPPSQQPPPQQPPPPQQQQQYSPARSASSQMSELTAGSGSSYGNRGPLIGTNNAGGGHGGAVGQGSQSGRSGHEASGGSGKHGGADRSPTYEGALLSYLDGRVAQSNAMSPQRHAGAASHAQAEAEAHDQARARAQPRAHRSSPAQAHTSPTSFPSISSASPSSSPTADSDNNSGSSPTATSNRKYRASDIRERLKRRAEKVDSGGVAVSRHQVQANARDQQLAKAAMEKKYAEQMAWEAELQAEARRQKNNDINASFHTPQSTIQNACLRLHRAHPGNDSHLPITHTTNRCCSLTRHGQPGGAGATEPPLSFSLGRGGAPLTA